MLKALFSGRSKSTNTVTGSKDSTVDKSVAINNAINCIFGSQLSHEIDTATPALERFGKIVLSRISNWKFLKEFLPGNSGKDDLSKPVLIWNDGVLEILERAIFPNLSRAGMTVCFFCVYTSGINLWLTGRRFLRSWSQFEDQNKSCTKFKLRMDNRSANQGEDKNDAIGGVCITIQGDRSNNKQPLNHRETMVDGNIKIEGMVGDQPMTTNVICKNGTVSNLRCEKNENLRKKYKYRSQCKLKHAPSVQDVISKLRDSGCQHLKELDSKMEDKFEAKLSSIGEGCLEIEFLHADKAQAEKMKNNEHVVKDFVVSFLENINTSPSEEIELSINVSENPMWNESSYSGPDHQSSVMPNRQSVSTSESQTSDRETLEHKPQKKVRLTTKQLTDSESDSDSLMSDIGIWKESPAKDPDPVPPSMKKIASLRVQSSISTTEPKKQSLKRKWTTKSESDSDSVTSNFEIMGQKTKGIIASLPSEQKNMRIMQMTGVKKKTHLRVEPSECTRTSTSSTSSLGIGEDVRKDIVAIRSGHVYEIHACEACHSVMGESSVPDGCLFNYHIDTPILKRGFMMRIGMERIDRIDRLVRLITALRNSGGGVIYLHFINSELDMTLYEEYISERSRVFVKAEDGECDEQVYNYDFHRSRDDFVVLTIQASQSLVTYDNKTTINRHTVCTDRQINSFLFGEETTLNDGSPTVRGIHHIKNTRETRAVELDPGETMHSEKAITKIWNRENLHKHLASLSKLTSGGSIYICMDEYAPRPQLHHTFDICGHLHKPCTSIIPGRQKLIEHGFPFTSYEKKNIEHTLSIKIKDELLWGSRKGPVQDVMGYFRICFHHVNTDEEIIEIAIGRFPGCVFFDKLGPEAYEVDRELLKLSSSQGTFSFYMDKHLKRLDFPAWLERQRSGNDQGSVL